MRHQRRLCPGRLCQRGGPCDWLVGAGLGSYKINADNQLRLAPAVALDLGALGVCGGWEVLARGRAVASGAASIAWRASGDWRAALHWWKLRGVTGDGGSSCVDGWRATDHLRGRSSSLSCRAWEAGVSQESQIEWRCWRWWGQLGVCNVPLHEWLGKVRLGLVGLMGDGINKLGGGLGEGVWRGQEGGGGLEGEVEGT